MKRIMSLILLVELPALADIAPVKSLVKGHSLSIPFPEPSALLLMLVMGGVLLTVAGVMKRKLS
jgi:hypothetical protein